MQSAIPPSSFMPSIGGNLNTRRDAEKQSDKKILVYSRKPKARHKENLTPEVPKQSEPMVAPESHDTINVIRIIRH